MYGLEQKISIGATRLSENFYSVPSTASAKVEKDGWLTKQGGMVKTWKRRWFVLKVNYLYYYKLKEDPQPLGFIPIDRASIKVLEENPHKKSFCFGITDPW